MHLSAQTVVAVLAALPAGMAIPLWQPAAPAPQPQRTPPRPHHRLNRLNGDGPAIVANANYNVPMAAGPGNQATGTAGTGTVGTGFAAPTLASGISHGSGLPVGTGLAHATGLSGHLPWPTSTGARVARRALVGSGGWNGTAAAQPHGSGTGASGSALTATGSRPMQTGASAGLAPSGRPVHLAALHRRIANGTHGHAAASGTAPSGAAGTGSLSTGLRGTAAARPTAPTTSVTTVPHAKPTEVAERMEPRGDDGADEPCSAGEIRCESLGRFGRCEAHGGILGLGATSAWVRGQQVEDGQVCIGGKLSQISARSADSGCVGLAQGGLVCAEEGAMYGTCDDGKASPLKVVQKGFWCVKGELVEVTKEA